MDQMQQVKTGPRKTSFTRDEILTCSRGVMFGPDNARLPLPPMLMVDRITEASEKGGKYDRGFIKGELDINPDLWFFQCHFESDPVMPGCLGLDAMWQLVGFYLGWLGHPGTGRALGVGSVKFRGQVLETSKLVSYEINFKRILSRGNVIGFADGIMSVDGVKIYDCEGLQVGLFDKEGLRAQGSQLT